MIASGSHSSKGHMAAGLPVNGPFENASTKKTGMSMFLKLMMNASDPVQRYVSNR
jgi:hypothetical protein